MSTRDWVLANEVGWGLPHGVVALLAAVAVAVRSVGLQVGRLAGWLAARRGRRAS